MSERKRGKGQLILMILIVIISFAVFMQSSFFNITKISVVGAKELGVNEVINLTDIKPGQNLFKVNIKEANENLKLHPWINEVNVKRKFPSTLEINLTEHTAVAVVIVENKYAVVEENGMILEYTDNLASVLIPIITGARMKEKITYGEQIQEEAILRALAIANKTPPEIYNILSEINVTNNGNIVVFLTNGLHIRLGSAKQAGENMERAIELLNELDTNIAEIAYIDLRFNGPPVISYGQ
ncbi:cell division protein FtsQ [Desulfitispora alkaliphila]|uniref:cell division protein FtsQ/DivIB n=1 Tax=Desulfitispora alkaliphila TaxID=622674 RepID=UPI003D2029D1